MKNHNKFVKKQCPCGSGMVGANLVDYKGNVLAIVCDVCVNEVAANFSTVKE